MDQTGEEYGVINEEYWGVVPNQVPDAIISVELHGEASDVSDSVSITTFPKNCRKPLKPHSYRAIPHNNYD